MLDRIVPKISSVVTNNQAMGSPNRWDDMGLTAAHLTALRTAMTDSGIENTNPNFAKYLFNLSAVYMNLSGTARLGSEGASVIPLRAYAYVLMRAAAQADNTVFRPGEIEGEDGYLEIARADRCAHVLSKDITGTARLIDRLMFSAIIHQSLGSNAHNVARPEGKDRPRSVRLDNDAGDWGISILRRQQCNSGEINNEIVRVIDSFDEESEKASSFADQNDNAFRNYMLQLMGNLDNPNYGD